MGVNLVGEGAGGKDVLKADDIFIQCFTDAVLATS